MKAIDRVMKAYTEKYQLTDAQAAFVRKEFVIFIDELSGRSVGSVQITTMLSDREL